MYEFLIGVVVGALGAHVAARRQARDAATQADLISPLVTMSTPIPMKRKMFVPGELKNFWGKDS